MPTAYLSLGSNLGDRVSYLQQATQYLKDHPDIRVKATSSLYETEPVGYAEQEWFVNAVITVDTDLSPDGLLALCQHVEARLGRERDEFNRNGPRTIDIDILFFDDRVVDQPDLNIPHPRLHERAFALVPLLEVNPHFVHPTLQCTVERLHQDLPNPEEVFLYGTRRSLPL